MCGIFGYKGKGDMGKMLLEGISRLDYRGYDSIGFAALNNGAITVKKAVGRIRDAKKKIDFSQLGGSIGIAHSRWSTHGEVNEANAHPHMSCDRKIAAVHNGIIENFQELKDELIMKGHKFASQTDSEVIAHLIEEEIKNAIGIREAVKAALLMLNGNYAIAVLYSEENILIGARRGSPLVIGIGRNEHYISSDVQAFLKYTNKAVFLDDNEIVFINDCITIENFLTNKNKNALVQEVDAKIWSSEKGKFQHFMLKEIYEQPAALNKTFKSASEDIKKLRMMPFNKIVLLGCGTAYYAGLVGTYLIEQFLRFSASCEYASEFRYRKPVVDNKTLIIAISQSGETADTLAAVREAKDKGAFILSICNVPHSTLVRESDRVLMTMAGPEIGVASTKAFTSQVMVLAVFALYYAKFRKDYNREQLLVYSNQLLDVPNMVKKVLEQYERISEIADKYACYRNFLFLGRGYLYPIALEGALKLKEISYVHAEGQSAAELKHGPIALIDKDMPSVFLAAKDELYDKVLSNMQEVKARGGKIIAIASEDDKKISKLADEIIYIPCMSRFLSPITSVVVLQLLAYLIALRRGCDIDKPRNLAKVVTVE